MTTRSAAEPESTDPPVPPDLRIATLDAAARPLATECPRGLAVRRIAVEAGCSTIPMPIYHYFDGKHGLLDALHVEGHPRLRAAQRSHQFTDDPEADVRNTRLIYRQVALTYADYFQVMFGHAAHGLNRPTGDTRTTARENYPTLIEVIRSWGSDPRCAPTPNQRGRDAHCHGVSGRAQDDDHGTQFSERERGARG